MHRSGLKSDPSGQAAVEALLMVAVFALILFGGFELSRGVALRHALDTGSSAAARSLSLDPAQWASAKALIQSEVNRNGLGGSPTISLKVYDSSGTLQTKSWLAGSAFGTAFTLEASAPFQADIPFIAPSPVIIQVQHHGIVERYP